MESGCKYIQAKSAECHYGQSGSHELIHKKTQLHFSHFSGNNDDRKPCNLTPQETTTVPVVASSELPPLPPVTMNNGKKDTSNSDVQKLQEQLNDIKEQVSTKGQFKSNLKFVL